MTSSPLEIQAVLKHLDPEQLDELDRLLTAEIRWEGRWKPHPDNVPQCRAVDHPADVLLFGGEVGGGKSALICGLSLTRHWRSAIFRRVRKHTTDLEDQLIRFAGTRRGYSDGKFNLPDGRYVELAGVKNLGDEENWRGEAHDLKAFDQVEQFHPKQFRFLAGWNRTHRKAQRCRIVATANPPINEEERWILKYWGPWLDPTHPHPAEDGELRWYVTVTRHGEDVDVEVDGPDPVEIDGETRYPLSRSFIRSRLEDNPYIGTEKYRAVIGNLPGAIRELMGSGDFHRAQEDHPQQVIPSAWVDLAFERWRHTPRPEVAMTCVAVDVARGGQDDTVVTPRWANWLGRQKVEPGKQTPDGKSVVAIVLKVREDDGLVLIDMGGGYGGSPADILGDYEIPVVGLNGAEACNRTDRTGKLLFMNMRAFWIWSMREALDPEIGDELCLPPDPELKADLCSFRWRVNLRGIQIESKDEIVARLGRSPGKGDSAVYSIAEMDLVALGPAAFTQTGTHTQREMGSSSMSPWEEGL